MWNKIAWKRCERKIGKLRNFSSPFYYLHILGDLFLSFSVCINIEKCVWICRHRRETHLLSRA
jgi:hypothetical protein